MTGELWQVWAPVVPGVGAGQLVAGPLDAIRWTSPAGDDFPMVPTGNVMWLDDPRYIGCAGAFEIVVPAPLLVEWRLNHDPDYRPTLDGPPDALAGGGAPSD